MRGGDELVLAVCVRRKLGTFTLDVSFETPHERTVLLGPSGGGKTLTLRAIAGLLRLDEGRITLLGRVLYESSAGVDVPAHRRRVGYVPQGFALFPHLDVAGNVLFGVARRDPNRRRRLAELLELVGLQGLERRRIVELSGGQQQRVAIARALAVGPGLLLLDEPFSALDPDLRRSLRDDLLELQERASVPMLTVTHDVHDAYAMGETIAVIAGGRVLQYGPREELFNRPRTLEVARLVGFRNALPGRVAAVREGWCEVAWAGGVLAVEGAPFHEGSRVIACIRPAQVMVRRLEDAAPRGNLLTGLAADEAPTPEGRRIRFLVGGNPEAQLEIDVPEYAYYRLGLDRRKAFEVSVAPSAVWLVPG